MTTPQQDIQALFDLMSPNGEIRLRRHNGHFVGDRAADKRKLRTVTGAAFVTDDNYDDMLGLISEHGYCFCTIEDEEGEAG